MSILRRWLIAFAIVLFPGLSIAAALDDTQIAFVTDRDGNDEIYLMDSSGGNLVNVTQHPASDIDPAWSPDGSQIVFASDRGGDFDIYIMNRDGSNLRQITNSLDRDNHPTWSPEDNWIVFARWSGDEAVLLRIKTDGTNRSTIYTGASHPVWSPEMSKLAVEGHKPYRGQVREEGIHRFTGKTRGGYAWHGDLKQEPAWSSTGVEIAMTLIEDDQRDIIRRGGSSGEVRLTTHPADDYAPAWSPDSQQIIFTSERDGNAEIYAVGRDADNLQNLTNHPANDRDAVWSFPAPDYSTPYANTQIAYARHGIHILDHNGSEERFMLSQASDPEWSPDGRRIAYVLDADIWTAKPDGSGAIRLTDDGASANDLQPSWSPDSQQIAFSTDRDGNREIYVMNADGSDQRRLTFQVDLDEKPAWSPLGNRIAFISRLDPSQRPLPSQRNTQAIYFIKPDGTGLTYFLGRNPIDMAWSPNGQQLAVALHVPGATDSSQISRINADKSGLTRLTNGAGFHRSPTWSPDGDMILYSLDGLTSGEIYLMNADGSGKRLFRQTGSSSVDITWSPELTSDNARITPLRPAANETLPYHTRSVTLEVDIDLHGGGWRWRLDEPFPTSGPIGGNVGSASATATIGDLEPGETYTVYVALVDESGALLNSSATSSVSFSVAEGPTVEILSPNGHEFDADTGGVELTVQIDNHDGPWHWRLDRPFPTSGYIGGNAVESGNVAAVTGLTPGEHTVYVALVDENHDLLPESVSASATFTVLPPDYSVETTLPQGLSIFSAPVDSVVVRWDGNETRVLEDDGVFTAHDLLRIGSTIVVRLHEGRTQSVVGRDYEPRFGADFPIEPARGYVVNMLEPTTLEIEGPPHGVAASAPSQAVGGANWAFVVAGVLPDELRTNVYLPSDLMLRVTTAAGGVGSGVVMDEGGFYLAALVDQDHRAVVSAGDMARIELLTPDGYVIHRSIEALEATDLRRAYRVVSLNARPSSARLLANFPNPFNPETWIPFELRDAAEASIVIFDMRGAVVRRLDLGFRQPGYYVAPRDAAFWDGRNELGETVGSGAYVYELRAGSDRDRRRLLVTK